MPDNGKIKPTCSGKLLSNQYFLSITCNHDISCECCSDKVRASIPIVFSLFILDRFPSCKSISDAQYFPTGLGPSRNAPIRYVLGQSIPKSKSQPNAARILIDIRSNDSYEKIYFINLSYGKFF